MKLSIGLLLLVAVLTIPACGNHIIYSFKEDKPLFLIAGVIMPPVGVLHGYWLYFFDDRANKKGLNP